MHLRDPERVPGLAGRTALCLDYDGTLSPIVDDPEAAAPLEGTLELLDRADLVVDGPGASATSCEPGPPRSPADAGSGRQPADRMPLRSSRWATNQSCGGRASAPLRSRAARLARSSGGMATAVAIA
jgi:hypothetical protein